MNRFCIAFASLLIVLFRQRLAEIGKGLTLTVALHRAQTPRERLKGARDEIGILQLIHELVEDLTRLGGSQANKRWNIRAGRHLQVRAVKDSDSRRCSKGTLVIFARVDGKGDLLIVLENIRQRRRRPVLLVVLGIGARGACCACRARRACSIASVVAIASVVVNTIVIANAAATDRLERNGRLDLRVMSREIVNLRGKRSNGSLGNGQAVLEIGK